MRKTLTLTIILVSALVGILLGSQIIQSRPQAEIAGVQFQNSPDPIPVASPTPQPTTPTKLSIPAINVNANIESVSLDSQNRMDVPKKAENVAWYNLGSKPGAFGNAVIAGHFDKTDGSPAVFYNISKLKIGDNLTVEDSEGQTFTFSVTQITTYPYNQVPLQEIFGEANGTYLNLITCEGSFDNTSKNYSHRTVVYSELI